MARVRQCLFGIALEFIRGLGVSEGEYEAAKEILKAKFSSQRGQLRETNAPNNDVRGVEKLADLVSITVVMLKAEGRNGELREGTLHSLLVKKLAEANARVQPLATGTGPGAICS